MEWRENTEEKLSRCKQEIFFWWMKNCEKWVFHLCEHSVDCGGGCRRRLRLCNLQTCCERLRKAFSTNDAEKNYVLMFFNVISTLSRRNCCRKPKICVKAMHNHEQSFQFSSPGICWTLSFICAISVRFYQALESVNCFLCIVVDVVLTAGKFRMRKNEIKSYDTA